MEKFYSKIIGTPVADDGIRPITTVRGVVIDPETGKLAALLVNYGKNMVIVPINIIFWQDIVRIHSSDDIVGAEEIMRVKQLMDKNIRLYRQKVFSQDGNFMGKVYDFSIDPESLTLKNLYVAKDFLGLFRFGSRIIPSKEIVEILRDRIVVVSNLQTVKEAKKNVIAEDMAQA